MMSNLSVVAPVADDDLVDWWLRQRLLQLGTAVPNDFDDSLVLLVAWLLWKERNS
jgi:hypothetical protein